MATIPGSGVIDWTATGRRDRDSIELASDTLQTTVWVHPRLVEAPTPTARTTDPDTSHEAATAAQGRQRDHHTLVLRLLKEHGPLTDFDLAHYTGLKQTSVGVRRGELVTLGLVQRHDRDGISDTGSPCIRWALTAAGRRAA